MTTILKQTTLKQTTLGTNNYEEATFNHGKTYSDERNSTKLKIISSIQRFDNL